jgi:hypothetical protein
VQKDNLSLSINSSRLEFSEVDLPPCHRVNERTFYSINCLTVCFVVIFTLTFGLLARSLFQRLLGFLNPRCPRPVAVTLRAVRPPGDPDHNVYPLLFFIRSLRSLQQLAHFLLQPLHGLLHPSITHRLVLAGVCRHLAPIQGHTSQFQPSHL